MTIPDKWVIIKIKTDADVLYKVFANFYGGYLSGNSWLINSGIKSYTEEKDHYLFHGYSGSIYKCYKKNEGMTIYGIGIFDYLKQKNDTPIRTISVRTFKKVFNDKPKSL